MPSLIYFTTVVSASVRHQTASCCQEDFTVVMYWVCIWRGCVCMYGWVSACACLCLHVLCLLPGAPVRGPNRINALICVIVWVCGWARPELKATATADFVTRQWSGLWIKPMLFDPQKLVVVLNPPSPNFVLRDLLTKIFLSIGLELLFSDFNIRLCGKNGS